MSEHLPECRAHEFEKHGLIIGDCICDRLRAAEQRGRDAAVAAARGGQA